MPNSINMSSLSFHLREFLEPTLFIIVLFSLLVLVSLLVN
jgi:hypothetical protein